MRIWQATFISLTRDSKTRRTTYHKTVESALKSARQLAVRDAREHGETRTLRFDQRVRGTTCREAYLTPDGRMISHVTIHPIDVED